MSNTQPLTRLSAEQIELGSRKGAVGLLRHRGVHIGCGTDGRAAVFSRLHRQYIETDLQIATGVDWILPEVADPPGLEIPHRQRRRPEAIDAVDGAAHVERTAIDLEPYRLWFSKRQLAGEILARRQLPF